MKGDGKRVKRVKRKRFKVTISVRRPASAGRHTVRVIAVDSAATRGTSVRRFSRCAAVSPRFTG